MTDDDLLATCIADEAAGELYAGKVAVGCVVLNRLTKKYASDGTMAGTVLKKFQFSGFWFAMDHGHYTQVEFDAAGAAEKAQELYETFSKQKVWGDCVAAARDARAWEASEPLAFMPPPEFLKLTHDTVLYFNPAISATPKWATQEAAVTTIGHHAFFHA